MHALSGKPLLFEMRKYFIFIVSLFCLNEAFAQTNPEAQLQQGTAYVNGGNFQEGIDLLSLYLDSDPGNASARYYRALGYYNLKDFNNAMADLTTSLATAPQFTEALDLSGLIHMAQNMLTEATNDFTNAINSNPEFAPAYLNRAMVGKIKKQYSQAVADLDRAITINPALLEAYYQRGVVKLLIGTIEPALIDFNFYIENVTDRPGAYVARGLAFYQDGKYAEAAADLEQALQLNPALENDFKNILEFSRSNAGGK